MKKRFSMLLALTMLLTSLIPSFTANAAFSDVDASHPYQEAISTLSTLKVINGYEDGTFAPDKDISRAEFTKMIVYMLGLGNLTTPITTFDDVPQTHWANPNIKTAYDLQIINGFDDGSFRPDQPVTYEQALKMVVCTLGYQPYAEQMGGYPNGYREQASALELTDKISNLGFSDNAPRGVIAQIMFNALEVEKHESVNGTWKASGKTLLNDYLNVEALKGTLVGVEDSTTAECNAVLAPKTMAVKDSITGQEFIIDFSEHDITVAELIDNLGRTVQVYYRKDKLSDDKWLVELSTDIHKNAEVTINSADIQEFDTTIIKYRKDGSSKTTSARLDMSNLSVRYNGRAVTAADSFDISDYLDPTKANFIYGTVRLISNDTKEIYSMVDIYDYEVIVAQRALQTTDYRIQDKVTPSKTLTLDPDALDYTFTLTRNGNNADSTKISANDVVVYAESLDGTFKTVKASSASVSGKIDSLNTTKKTLAINGKTYPYSAYFENYLATKESRTLQSGLQIKAYTDAFGTIQWGTITSTESYYPYAYVIDVIPDAEEYYLRLFAPSSTSVKTLTSSTSYKVKSYRIAENAKLNGSKKSPEAIVSALAESDYAPDTDATNTTGYEQFIRVGFNSSGEIDNVITVSDTTGIENTNAEQLVRYSNAGTYKVNTNAVKDGSTTLYSIKSSTPLFVIPSDRSDTDAYAVKNTISSSSMTAGSSYFIEAYDLNSSKYPTFVATYGTAIQKGTPIAYTSTFKLLATDIEQEVDTELDEVFDMLRTFNCATSVTNLKISNEATDNFSSLEKGDVILTGLDGDNYADTYWQVMDYTKVREVLDGTTCDWTATQTQTAANHWQKYVFDFRYPKSGASATDSYYMTSSNTTGILSRVAMFNVLQVLPEEKLLYLTKEGFDADGNAIATSYETIAVSDNTKILRYDADADEYTPYIVDSTSTTLTISDILDIENYGMGCSKIMLHYYSETSGTPTAKFIVIYE